MSLPDERLARARLYAIVDLGYVAPEAVPAVTADLVRGGVDLIQLRAKKLPLEIIAKLGAAMRDLIPSGGPFFILNDHPELVPAIGADGIHVGQDDLPVAEARARAGGGVLVGKVDPLARSGRRGGEGGPGLHRRRADLRHGDQARLRAGHAPRSIGRVRAAVRLPQFCIGGVNEATLPEVIAAGARRVVHRLRAAAKRGYSRLLPARARRARGRAARSLRTAMKITGPSDTQLEVTNATLVLPGLLAVMGGRLSSSRKCRSSCAGRSTSPTTSPTSRSSSRWCSSSWAWGFWGGFRARFDRIQQSLTWRRIGILGVTPAACPSATSARPGSSAIPTSS
ncbi:MAG: thiamine phosphate synthase [Verrucomicrobiota bacterium]